MEYHLTPEAARMLDSGSFKGMTELNVLAMRFIQGRELRELGAPNDEEMKVLQDWYDETITNIKIIDHVIAGNIYLDWDEEGKILITKSSK